jgi:hypothetical protein
MELVIQTRRRLDLFLQEAAQNIQDQNYKIKNL